MPGLFYRPMSRKTFLNTSAKMVGAVALAHRPGRLLAADRPSVSAHLALLSDTHIPADATDGYRGFRPVDNLQQVVPQVVAAAPDAVIIDGDAARLTGQEDDYQSLKNLLAPLAARSPVYIGLGNHDDRGNFYRVFDDAGNDAAPVNGKHVAVIDRGGLRFIVLDSLLYVDKTAGLLGKAQRTWLTRFLRESGDRPHVLFVHHTLGDGDGDLLDVDRLFGIIEPHRKVKALFYGHSHRWTFDRRKHIHLVNLPAVGYNFADSEPVGWIDARFSADGAELTLHAIGGNRDGDGKTTTITWA